LLLKASAFLDNVKVLSGKKLKKKLRKDPKRALTKCGADMGCLAKLGKKVRANEVLLVKTSPASNGGVQLFFVFIDVKRKTLARKQKIEIASVDQVKVVMGSVFYELFGYTDPGTIKVAGAVGAVNIDGELVGTGPGPYKVRPGRREIVADGMMMVAMCRPVNTRASMLATASLWVPLPSQSRSRCSPEPRPPSRHR